MRSGTGSLCFEPSTGQLSPTSPYIDQKVPGAQQGQLYELSFWIKTAPGGEPIRFWVGGANSDQWPSYMSYKNYLLPAGRNWMRLRTHVSYDGSPPLVLRFWCPATSGKMWLDDVILRPVEARSIDVLLNPPANAMGWGSVDWKLAPADARCKARIVDSEHERDLWITLYSGDSLAPLAAVVERKPVVLRLEFFPSTAQPVTLEKVQARFTSKSSD